MKIRNVGKKSLAPAVCFLVFFALFLMTACKQGAPVIRIESAEAKLSPMLIGVASVFMEIVNTGDGNDTLVSAKAEIPETITELHDVQDNRMVKAAKMRIPSNDSLLLKPGGSHIMIFNLPRDSKDGFQFNLTLTFLRSGAKTISVKLTTIAPNQLPGR